MISAVVYDFDNTLVATDEYVRQHIIETAERVLGKEEASKIMVLDKLKAVQKANTPFEVIFTTTFGEELGKRILAAYRETAVHKPYFSSIGGVSLVNALKERSVLQGILTNRTRMVEERLSQAGYPKLDFILTPPSDDLRKPNPRSFDRVIEFLQQKGVERKNCVSIGDHTDDYLAASGAGLRFIGVLTGLTTREDFLAKGLERQFIAENLVGAGKIIEKM